MASKLQLYNHALLLMKERRLSGLTEDRESRRILDEFYTQVVKFCLEQGMWKFAMRSASLSQVGAGAYGFQYRFNKPDDFIHLFEASETSDYDNPLTYNIVDEGTIFYAKTPTLYIRYSSDFSHLGNAQYDAWVAAWPQGFAQYVAAELAAWACYSITGNERIVVSLDRKAKVLLANALALYSLVAPPGQLPFNTWARSITAAEAINTRPELMPFGAEIKAMLSGGQQG